MPRPFVAFTLYLLPPTLINLALTYPLLLLLFRDRARVVVTPRVVADDPWDPGLAKLALAVLMALVPLYFIADLYPNEYITPVTLTLAGASAIYAASSRRREILHNVEWGTIVFFLGLFIVSYGALESGALGLVTRYLPQPTTLWGYS
jgi:Na+/H+ antiporter NhaD/arsenite permease-like protein